MFGSLLIVGFAIAFRQEPVSSRLTKHCLLFAGINYVVLTGFHIQGSWGVNNTKYQKQTSLPLTLTREWNEGGWMELPRYRQDLYGESEEPFVLQCWLSAESKRRT